MAKEDISSVPTLLSPTPEASSGALGPAGGRGGNRVWGPSSSQKPSLILGALHRRRRGKAAAPEGGKLPQLGGALPPWVGGQLRLLRSLSSPWGSQGLWVITCAYCEFHVFAFCTC